MDDVTEKCCGWCAKINTPECEELFVTPSDEDVCDKYEYGLPFREDEFPPEII